jgi:hypothetical protein
MKVPVDASKPATKMSPAEAKRWGLITQAAAHRKAAYNGGELGTSGNVTVTAAGTTGYGGGSYVFKQAGSVRVTKDGKAYDVSNIRRTVSYTGKGQAISTAKWTPVSK